MSEYINREALLEDLQEEIEFESTMFTKEQNEWFTKGLKCAVRDVKSQPTADVVEVKHGEWIPQIVSGKRVWNCSECKTPGSPRWKLCPVCETKMDKKKGDEL